jgi:transposase
MWYAGIDWADQHHDVVVIDATGQRVGQLRVPHSAEGVSQLCAWLRQIGDIATCLEHVACMIETTHGVLITALLEQGFAVYPVNTTRIKQGRKPSGAKTDAIDAGILARVGRSELPELRRLQPDSPLLCELKTLTRDQDALIQTQTRLTNQLIACLKAYYPGALTWFAQVAQGVTLSMLEAFPTPAHWQAASVADMRAILTQRRYPKAEQKAQRLWEQAQGPQLHAEPLLAQAKTRYMLALVAQLRLVLQQVAEYDAEILQVFAAHGDHAVFASVLGGKRIAPRLLAEWGEDRLRYPCAASVQALAGTAPVIFQSGNYRRTRMRTACSKPLRNVLYQLARVSLRQEAWATSYYQRKRAEGKPHAMAVRALANQWVRILYAVWAKRAVYDPQVFVQAQRAHGRQVA